MEAMDEIKEQKRLNKILLLEKTQEVSDKLEQLKADNQKLYINGASESLKEYCVVTKTDIKIKDIEHERSED